VAGRSDKLADIVEKADKIISKIDAKEMAAHYGTKIDENDVEQARARKEWDEKKEIYINAIYRKGIALSEMKTDKEKIVLNTKELKKWADVDNAKLNLLECRQNKEEGHYALALQSATKKLSTIATSDSTKKELLDQQIELVELLGWKHWHEYLVQYKHISYPQQYRPF